VEVYTDDARAFLTRSDKTYDMIVFALPDSLILASSMSSVRLESFLFTRESFESVRSHLKPDGVFVLYNYYRFDWLVDKIAFMLAEVFGDPLLYHTYADPESERLVFATFFAGPGLDRLAAETWNLSRIRSESQIGATDDWPFLYMKDRSLPWEYTAILAMILLISVVFVGRFASYRVIPRDGWPYFFMGVAFMLLEAKSLVNFFLLFGATWLVNSLVFFAVLLTVLLANAIVGKYRITQLSVPYLLLLGALGLNFALPLDRLIIDNLILRYVLASALLFSPIFMANLIYSSLFRGTRQANIAFGANLLGAMAGGSIEYLAILLGYHNLVLLAGLFYGAAFFLVNRKVVQTSEV
jgi:hypothetical protein